MPCAHNLAAAQESFEFLSPQLVHNQWQMVMDIAPQSLEGLQTVAHVQFESLLELPKHALRRIFKEVNTIKTGQYALVPILPPIVKLNNQGCPQTGSQKTPAVSKLGRWISQYEVKDIKERKQRKARETNKTNSQLPKRHLTASATATTVPTTSLPSTSRPKQIYRCGACGTPGHQDNSGTCKVQDWHNNPGISSSPVADHLDDTPTLLALPELTEDLKEEHFIALEEEYQTDLSADGNGKVLCPFYRYINVLSKIIMHEICLTYFDDAKKEWNTCGRQMLSFAGQFEGFEIEEPG
ncbi:hypothetical protein DFH28DRAFT_922895 [Melampsora americana]|nr:hypothetical protein DFH28DRAFT_922895 [Melampsora americana]